MRFTFVDRVLDLEPGVRITTVKSLSMGEEYLADHFPRFPVMPGVLMLEAMAQASAWLIRASDQFEHSIVTLKEARNIRFADFVQPGRLLTVTAEILRAEPGEVQIKAQGTLEQRVAVSGRLTMQRYNLSDAQPELAATDAYLRGVLKEHFAVIYRPAGTSASNGSALLAPIGSAAEPSQGKV